MQEATIHQAEGKVTITKATGAPATGIVTMAATTAGSLDLTAPLML